MATILADFIFCAQMFVEFGPNLDILKYHILPNFAQGHLLHVWMREQFVRLEYPGIFHIIFTYYIAPGAVINGAGLEVAYGE